MIILENNRNDQRKIIIVLRKKLQLQKIIFHLSRFESDFRCVFLYFFLLLLLCCFACKQQRENEWIGNGWVCLLCKADSAHSLFRFSFFFLHIFFSTIYSNPSKLKLTLLPKKIKPQNYRSHCSWIFEK